MIAGQLGLEDECGLLLDFNISSVIWRIASASLLLSVIWRIASVSYVARARSVTMSKGA